MDAKKHASLQVKVDRYMFTADPSLDKSLPTFAGYEVVKDFRPRNPRRLRSYARVRWLRTAKDTSRIRLQYKPLHPWCRPLHITFYPDDFTGITRDQLNVVLAPCSRPRISLIELAFDFPSNSGVDNNFVLQHARFGKSRRRIDRGGKGQLRYGDRGSPKLVRCYWKDKIQRHRVELELHSSLLRRIGVNCPLQFPKLYGIVPPHFSFVSISWERLERYFRKNRFGEADALMEGTRARAERSLQRALRFLKRSGVANPHRFLVPLRRNKEIKMALRNWLDSVWRPEDQEADVYP